MQLLNGKEVSAAVRERVRRETAALAEKGVKPGLAVIIVGDDPASQVYVRNKEKACAEVGYKSKKYALPSSTTQQQLNSLVRELNERKDINGILCQLPLPAHLNDKEVIELIDPAKDVDAFHPVNVGRIMIGDYDFLPCTPAGIMELIKSAGIETRGKKAVVVGRSKIVGRPMMLLLLNADATVTVCHSKTIELKRICSEADILIAAVGKPHFITADMVKQGAVIIDVGINRIDGKLAGDVDFDRVAPKTSFITPVPGGVGPMTIAMLLKNTLDCARRSVR